MKAKQNNLYTYRNKQRGRLINGNLAACLYGKASTDLYSHNRFQPISVACSTDGIALQPQYLYGTYPMRSTHWANE